MLHFVENVASAQHFQPLSEEDDEVLLSDCAMLLAFGECLWHALHAKLVDTSLVTWRQPPSYFEPQEVPQQVIPATFSLARISRDASARLTRMPALFLDIFVTSTGALGKHATNEAKKAGESTYMVHLGCIYLQSLAPT